MLSSHRAGFLRALFLAGYGAAQALPGPLFTVAAFFGTIASVGPEGALGAAIATIAIFLPGLLLAAACLPYWQAIRHHPRIAAALNGVNAAVVGLLVAALVNLLQLHAIFALQDLGLLIVALLAPDPAAHAADHGRADLRRCGAALR